MMLNELCQKYDETTEKRGKRFTELEYYMVSWSAYIVLL